MMRVVDFLDEVGDRELQLVGPQPTVLILRCELMPGAEKEQNIRRLRHDSPARLEERRRKRQLAAFPAVKKAHQPRDAEALASRARYVHVFAARLLQSQAHELA